MFPCDCCGLCCRSLAQSEAYSDLDRGDGICMYFDDITNLCTIYENRPDKCNIDKSYERFFKNSMTLEEYYELNRKACDKLRKGGYSDVFSTTK